jgi:N-acetylneuraminic acid mutarotase
MVRVRLHLILIAVSLGLLGCSSSIENWVGASKTLPSVGSLIPTMGAIGDPSETVYQNTTTHSFTFSATLTGVTYEYEQYFGSGCAGTPIVTGSQTSSSYVMTGMTDGNTYSLKVRATNSLGSSSWVCSTTIGIDTQIPNSVSYVAPASNVTIGTTSYTASWSTTDNGIADLASTNRYLVETFTNGTCAGAAATSAQQQTASINLTGLVHTGVYSVRVTAYDKASNASAATCSSSITVNTSILTLALSHSTSNTNYARSTAIDATITNDATAAKWCLSESQTTAPASGAVACTGGTGWVGVRPTAFTLSGGNGSKTVYLWIADAGDVVYSTSTTATIYLDATNPTLGAYTAPSGDLFTSAASYSFTWNAGSDADSGLASSNTYRIRTYAQANCGGAVQATINQTSSPYSYTGFVNGSTYSIDLTVYDAAGNLSAATCSDDVTRDTTVPSITYGIAPASPTNDTTPTISGTCSDGASGIPTGGIKICMTSSAACNTYPHADFGVTVDCSAGTWTYTPAAQAQGTYDFKVVAVDTAGNVSATVGQAAQNYVIDTTNPGTIGTFVDGTSTTTTSDSAAMTWTAASDTGGAGISYYELAIGTSSGGTQTLNWTNIGNVVSYTRTGLTLANSTTYYSSIRAVDAAGNTGSAVNGDGWTTPAASGANTWASTTTTGAPSIRGQYSAVWTGSEMIVWGGTDGSYLNTGSRYNPTTNSWTATTTTGAPSARIYNAFVWTGNEMIIWGGYDGGHINSGGRYNPVTNAWSTTTTTGAPAGRESNPGVWMGDRMFVWGGYNGSQLNSGGIYNPIANSWTSTTTTGAPSERSAHASIWSGSQIIIWGGYSGGVVNTGGLYNPSSNTWSPTTTTGAPETREFPAGVWTGKEMIIWGGEGGSGFLNSGGRYNPVTNTWSATTTTSTLSIRKSALTGWTGAQLVLWGGWNGTVLLNNGAIYDPETNAWTAMTSTNAPIAREDLSMVWTGTQFIVWGGYDGAAYLNTGSRYTPPLATGTHLGTWAATTTTSAARERFWHYSFWTGSELLVWGGRNGATGALDTGGKYDPTTNAWTTITTTSAPQYRWRFGGVWTGKEMIVWGGYDGGALVNSGGRYNPISNTWQATTTTGAPSRMADTSAVWTGSEMIVWGGQPNASQTNTGGRYNPETNTWTATTTTGAPSPRFNASSVWTGQSLIVWAGINYSGNSFNTGGVYNPVNDSWTTVTTNLAPPEQESTPAVWTGSEMIVWSGTSLGRYNPATNTWKSGTLNGMPPNHYYPQLAWTGKEIFTWCGHLQEEDQTVPSYCPGALYNPRTDSWRLANYTDTPTLRKDASLVWTGKDILAWGGRDHQASLEFNTGGRYTPPAAWDTNTWYATTTTGAPAARNFEDHTDNTAQWTGSEMIVWGGKSGAGSLNTGARYNPVTNSWTAMTSTGVPTIRQNFASVWTGKEFIVWGGEYGVSTGGLYNPVTDAWSATTTTGAPLARYYIYSTWTGKEMLVWGGRDSGGTVLNSGGKYNPATNTWSTMTTTGAPSARAFYSVTWNGSKAIYWGGYDFVTDFLNTGGVYNPEADTWSTTTTTGAPSPRSHPGGAWTGSTAFIWGGWTSSGSTETGAKYNPNTDTWTSSTTTGAPSARPGAKLHWTGKEVLVWGIGNWESNSGGKYDPTNDSWSTTTTTGAPSARKQTTSVWTGQEMIVWGGINDAGTRTATGGRYIP